MKNVMVLILTPILLFSMHQLLAESNDSTLITFADGRADGGIRQGADTEDGLDSPGDIFVFDQKLLAEDATTVIGRNAGYCIRTDPGAPDFSSTDHPTLPDDPNNNYGQCTWTLSFNKNSGYYGSITVSGREADLGTSQVAIIGGTGNFSGATGVLISTPIPQGGNGVLFYQELIISHNKNSKDDD
jgi:hypothetical protein